MVRMSTFVIFVVGTLLKSGVQLLRKRWLSSLLLRQLGCRSISITSHIICLKMCFTLAVKEKLIYSFCGTAAKSHCVNLAHDEILKAKDVGKGAIKKTAFQEIVEGQRSSVLVNMYGF